MENKKSSKTIIITLTIVAAIAIIGIVVFLMGGKGRELKKCLDLGQKYLTEMNYEEAIASFEKAIEIDPMSADAYIGIADAYIGMAKDLFDEDNLDGALEELANAKSTLEDGIATLTKYADGNTGSKADDARKDISRLEEKLAEVDAEIARIEEEIEARRIAAEEEAARKAEEERIANLPKIYIQPLLDGLDNVWGRNWKEWTIDGYIGAFNLIASEYNDNTWYDKALPKNERVRQAYARESEGIGPYEVVEDVYEMQIENHGYWYSDERLTIHSDYRVYDQTVSSTNHSVPTDGLYTFCNENGLTSIEGAMNYFGLNGIDPENPIQVMTELGQATVSYYYDEDQSHYSCEQIAIDISENDGFTKILFMTAGFDEIGITEFEVSVSQSN